MNTRILLVEDNLVNQKVAVRMLQKLGYRVDVASTGKEALTVYQTKPYALILMDCQMPEMDGFETTREIRRREGSLENSQIATPHDENRNSLHDSRDMLHIPIIAMTANAMEGDREKCLEAGMDDFLSKPVDIKVLGQRIELLLTKNHEASDIENPNPIDSPPLSKANKEMEGRSLNTPLDPQTVQDLQTLGGEADPGFFLSLIEQFLQEIPSHVESIQQALATLDSESLIKAAYSFKGRAHYLGALSLAEHCSSLEESGKQGAFEHTAQQWELLQQELERVKQFIEQTDFTRN